jgi:mono/diheme cytochrome c family protein
MVAASCEGGIGMRLWMIPMLIPFVVSGIPAVPSAAAQEDGQALFEKNCQKCHGPDGRGDTKAGKRMKVPVWDETELERAQVIENVRTNKKHKTVSKKLSDAELDAIANYVATLLEAR